MKSEDTRPTLDRVLGAVIGAAYVSGAAKNYNRKPRMEAHLRSELAEILNGNIDNPWRHVDEELPENGRYVWASHDGGEGNRIADCQFRNGYFWIMDDDGETVHPTIWKYSNRPDDSPIHYLLKGKYKVKP